MTKPTADDLRKLIGTSLNLAGRLQQVVEVLDADSPRPKLVLQSGEQIIQGDQWGDAQRRVPATTTLAVFTDNLELQPVLAALLKQQD